MWWVFRSSRLNQTFHFFFSPLSSAKRQVVATFDSNLGDAYIVVNMIEPDDSSGIILENSKSTSGWKQIAFSRDGKFLAALNPQEVRIWNVTENKLINTIPLTRDINKSIAFSPDGRKLAIAGFDEGRPESATLTLWNTGSPDDVYTFGGGVVEAISATGSRFVTEGYTRLILWDTIGRESFPLATYNDAVPPRVNFSPDGDYVAAFFPGVVERDGPATVRLWNAANHQEIKLQTRTDCRPWSGVAFTPDGKTLVNACEGRRLRMWRVDTGEEIHEVELQMESYDYSRLSGRIGALLKNNQLIVVNPDDNVLAGWDIETGARLKLEVCGEDIFKFSPDGNWLITKDQYSNYRLRKKDDKRCQLEPILRYEANQNVNAITFSNDSKLLGLFYNPDNQDSRGRTKFVVKDLAKMIDVLSEENSEEGETGDIAFSKSDQWARFGKKYWNLSTHKDNKIEGCVDRPTFSPMERASLPDAEMGPSVSGTCKRGKRF